MGLPQKAWSISYVDHALVQFAGEIGFISLGIGKNFSRYSFSVLYGIVPYEISKTALLETVTLRQTYRFYDWSNLSGYAGLNLFHVLGLTYQSSNYKDAPKGYYPIGSVRALLSLGIAGRISEKNKISFYAEAGLNDIWITNWVTNSDVINPTDHVSIALGLKKEF